MSHYKQYPSYKDSGFEWLGRVPEHWKVMPFKRVASICNGRDYKDVEDANGLYPVIGSGGEFARASAFVFDGESVLLGRKGTIDKPLYINGPFWAVDTMFYTSIADDAFGKFVYYSALTIPFNLYSTNTALPSMTGEDLSSHVIAAPEFTEQQNIAIRLDSETARIDALIAKKTRFIELLKEKRQALITHAVTKGLNPSVPMRDSGVEWIGEVPEHWDVLQVRRVSDLVKTGGTPSENPPGNEIKGGVSWYTPGDFNGSLILGLSERRVSDVAVSTGEARVFSAGSVLVVSIGATLGKVGYLKYPASANQQINAVIPNERVDGYFLAYSMSVKSDAMWFLANAATIGIMNQEKTKDIWIAVPPLDEQQKITKYLDVKAESIGNIIKKTERSIDLLKERRSAFITAAVTGQIDLREPA